MMTVYGIPQCSTVKKAKAWLDAHGLPYQFHDYKKQVVPEPLLNAWLAAFGWETVINQRGTSWRSLPESERNQMNTERAIAAVLNNASLIKRPILVTDQATLIGFDADRWQEALS